MSGYDEKKLNNAFTYHAPQGSQVARYNAIREAGAYFARTIANNSPCSAEQTTAINKVREAVMWANAGIACNEAPSE